ncbi:sensor histidine kinase [Agrobacterium pusense]|jgi:two-component sensor histidine kinase|uniref:sensor histidine kinase n=1 Tax=Agrobacterium pusense TaxID=648995 RepID=UPI0021D3B646|nr:sensor histidine kinase [Agrobacterium pusense]UXT91958.1 sensor histidine kinase [Agrobacterium pusense]
MNLHRLAWHNAERDESELHDSLVLALLDSGETVMLQDRNRDYIFVANLPDVWKLPAESPPTDENLFGKDLSGRLAELKKDMGAAGSRGMLEVGAGNDRVFQFHVHSTLNQMNQMVMKTTIREVTAERRREQLLRSLLREVSHRSKNLLAIIQSLAGQTARFSLTKDDFLRKFRGRLHALAQSQDLITDSDWRGARIFELLRQQFDLYVPEYPNLIHMEGENLLLNPNGALYIGLAFHELVVNTVSHSGNLAYHPPISLQCRQEGDFYIVEWNEPMTPSKEPVEARRGSFGSVVLEKVVPSALGGSAEYELTPERIVYRLKFPSGDVADM